ncbi:hypothetical protein MRB53_041637 [Persea americana]|nr:hypothetical protein MRB53_041637 [Persea americana]
MQQFNLEAWEAQDASEGIATGQVRRNAALLPSFQVGALLTYHWSPYARTCRGLPAHNADSQLHQCKHCIMPRAASIAIDHSQSADSDRLPSVSCSTPLLVPARPCSTRTGAPRVQRKLAHLSTAILINLC